MNLVLLNDHQFIEDQIAELTIRQQDHLAKVLKAKNGDRITIGILNGDIGYGSLLTDANPWKIKITQLDTPPPARIPSTIILALPRPQMIKRILQTVATMGVKKIILLQTSKVEKSFWQSPSVTEESLLEHLIIGAEQGIDTRLPIVEKHLRFRPFVEDILPELTAGKSCYISHPGTENPPPRLDSERESVLAIGPEGGFTDKEVDYFCAAGFQTFQLGRRILKVETAVPVILSSVYPYSFSE